MKTGGYNGGGNASGSDVNVYSNAGAGGGATHIATTSGLLTTLESTKDKILIVAAGGGGASGWDRYNKVYSDGGAGGGIVGNNGIIGKNSESSGNYTISTGGTQIAGGNGATGIEANGESGIFGQGGASGNRMYGGGGGGYYGGGGGGASYYTSISGAGGSSYIGNALLTNKAMYCYNCTESSEINTKTISTTCSEEDSIDNCTKKNNGYAKITLIADINIEYYDKNSNEMIVPKNSNYEFASITCLNKSNISWDSKNWGLIINDYQKNDTCKIYFTTKAVYEFSYTDSEQVFTIPKTGFYKLETWGAQGGTNGNYIDGYGGYSVGQISLNKGDKLYINVGGSGDANFTQTNVGGYNGGGYSGNNGAAKSFGGGGATHIATSSGLLSTFENNKDDILIVAAGGGGATSGSTTQGGSGGGYNGVDGSTSDSQWNSATYIPKGGTQDSSGYAYGGSARQGKFGTGQTSYTVGWAGGGGGGYYGGSNGHGTTGAGGSGYIGNYLLTDKTMYCYNCATSNDTNTKTISTICSEETPTENCAKTGNGYAKISYVSNVNLE